MNISSDPLSTLPPMIAMVISMLAKESYRWEDVELNLPLPMLSDFPAIKGHVQSLHTLRITTPDDPDDLLPLEAFQDAPLLRKVEIWDSQAISIVLPWAQLTSYTTNYLRLSTLLSTLSGMPNLESHALYYTPDDDGLETDTEINTSGEVHLQILYNLTIEHIEYTSDEYLAQLTAHLMLAQLGQSL
ncbi:hypothetical protein C8R44DRAFT_892275 [Mycena epipterygia]|nr:hypothetical protein C8R44DRAFT_892275 [Mycena epipterygia]